MNRFSMLCRSRSRLDSLTITIACRLLTMAGSPFTKAGTLGVMKVDGTTGKRLSSFDKDGVTQFAFDQLEIDAASIRTDASGKLWVHANLFSDQSLSFGSARLWK